MKENAIQKKSFDFALLIISLYKEISKNEQVISRQILKSGTSIGANVEEAIGAQSKKDFISKLSIAYKEARETLYWLKLMKESGILSEERCNHIICHCEELLKIIGAIQRTMKTEAS